LNSDGAWSDFRGKGRHPIFAAFRFLLVAQSKNRVVRPVDLATSSGVCTLAWSRRMTSPPIAVATADSVDPTKDTPRAWVMAAAASAVGFVVFGVVYSFGVFLAPLADGFGVGRPAVAGYYAIASLIWYCLGPVTGFLGDRFGPRALVAVGAAAMGGGLTLTAFIVDLRAGYLTYGVGVGLGAACAYVPTLANLGGWFERRRNAAFGLAAAGTGVGMLIVPPAAALLIEQAGWRAACIWLGAGSALLLVLCAATVSAPPRRGPDPSARRLADAVRSAPFVLTYVSWTLATTALFIPFVFLPQFAAAHGASPIAASALLSILGGASVVGRFGVGWLGDRFGPINLFKIATAGMATSYVLWLVRPDYSALVVFSVWLGVAYGVRIAVAPGVLIAFHGAGGLGALLGLFFTGTGVAAFAGPMAAGYVLDATEGYDWGIALALALGLAGLAAASPLRIAPQHGER